MLAVLFTETGIMPIRYRRALLALRYAKGFAGIPMGVEELPRAAFRESMRNAGLGHSCWASDLWYVLASLPVPVAMDTPALLTAEGIMKREIGALVKTQLLKNCLEPDDNGNLKTITLHFRHYLRLVNVV
ncbi:hypothetical protein B0H10DRAFT_2013909, partial [Mycena sp. CBHHK59/15]